MLNPVSNTHSPKSLEFYCFLLLTSVFSLSFVPLKKRQFALQHFYVGFITVLCIGNYFRAKRAQDRQRQRRLAKLADDATFIEPGGAAPGTGEYAPPRLSPASATGVQV
jgi:hypothetical protein